jgi:hypothetical protein
MRERLEKLEMRERRDGRDEREMECSPRGRRLGGAPQTRRNHKWHLNNPLFLLMLLIGFLVSCSTLKAAVIPTEVILSGKEDAIIELSEKILAGEIRVDAKWLSDSREFPRHVAFRVTVDDGMLHLGVDKISDFYLCLLQIKYKRGTKEILGDEIYQQIGYCIPEEKCEICNSLTYNIDLDLRMRLIQYWENYLSNEQ